MCIIVCGYTVSSLRYQAESDLRLSLRSTYMSRCKAVGDECSRIDPTLYTRIPPCGPLRITMDNRMDSVVGPCLGKKHRGVARSCAATAPDLILQARREAHPWLNQRASGSVVASLRVRSARDDYRKLKQTLLEVDREEMEILTRTPSRSIVPFDLLTSVNTYRISLNVRASCVASLSRVRDYLPATLDPHSNSTLACTWVSPLHHLFITQSVRSTCDPLVISRALLYLLDMRCTCHHFALESDVLLRAASCTNTTAFPVCVFVPAFSTLFICIPCFAGPRTELQVHIGCFTTRPISRISAASIATVAASTVSPTFESGLEEAQRRFRCRDLHPGVPGHCSQLDSR